MTPPFLTGGAQTKADHSIPAFGQEKGQRFLRPEVPQDNFSCRSGCRVFLAAALTDKRDFTPIGGNSPRSFIDVEWEQVNIQKNKMIDEFKGNARRLSKKQEIYMKSFFVLAWK